ncbi:hypothetical protein YC2023_122590 [Brassica napus]
MNELYDSFDSEREHRHRSIKHNKNVLVDNEGIKGHEKRWLYVKDRLLRCLEVGMKLRVYSVSLLLT